MKFKDETLWFSDEDSGPCQDRDGRVGYSLNVKLSDRKYREVIIYEGELEAMLNAVRKEQSPE